MKFNYNKYLKTTSKILLPLLALLLLAYAYKYYNDNYNKLNTTTTKFDINGLD
jgi:hypothetical protein